MNWLKENKGGALLTIIAILLGVALGVLLSSDFSPMMEAEAVIGGSGNVTEKSNPHNFSFGSTGVNAVDATMTQVCIFCHTPHHAKTDDPTLLNAPLWNHKLSAVSSYTVKTAGQAYGNTVGTPSSIYNVMLLSSPLSQPDGTSKLCLSCHDGTIAVGAVYSRTADIGLQGSCLSSGKISCSCSAYIGIDLTKKHVVSVPMNQKLKDDSMSNCLQGTPAQNMKLKYPWDSPSNANVVLRPTTATYSGFPGVTRLSTDTPINTYRAGYYYGVQCSTCHDPHFWVNTKDTNVTGAMFIVDKINNICKACHVSCP